MDIFIDNAKSAAAGLLFGGSLIAGLLPKWLGLAERVEHSLLLSIILCFGAGVLLATSVIHILHDTITALPNWGEIYFCAGFMILYFVDELVQFWCLVAVSSEKSVKCQHTTEPHEEESLLGRGGGSSSSSSTSSDSHSKYGSIKKGFEKDKLESQNLRESTNLLQKKHIEEDTDIAFAGEAENVHRKSDSKVKGLGLEAQQINPSRMSKDKNKDMIKKIGLIIAFSTHSILEGLAVGTQPTASKVTVLLLAVSCHKLVITFCLGAELISDGSSFATLFGSLSVYAFSSGIGVVIGAILNSTNTTAIPMLQGLAGGSLLYITVGEILPRERFHKNHCLMPKGTGLVQFFSVLCGIIPIALMNVLAGDSNS